MLNKLDEIEEHGGHSAGRSQMLKYLRGERITRGDAIKAKCYECNGYAVDGRPICNMRDCPLWPYSQFNKRGREHGKD